jgi:hypothetical protein
MLFLLLKTTFLEASPDYSDPPPPTPTPLWCCQVLAPGERAERQAAPIHILTPSLSSSSNKDAKRRPRVYSVVEITG